MRPLSRNGRIIHTSVPSGCADKIYIVGWGDFWISTVLIVVFWTLWSNVLT